MPRDRFMQCMTNRCDQIPVAAWSTSIGNNEYDIERWETCEECQEKDFEGWPENFANPGESDELTANRNHSIEDQYEKVLQEIIYIYIYQ